MSRAPGAVRVCTLADLAEGSVLAIDVDGLEVALVRSNAKLYAIRDQCSHAAVALSEGEVSDGEIECWLHGSRFDLTTGRPTCLPAYEPVDVYQVSVEGQDIYVDVAVDAAESGAPAPAAAPTTVSQPIQYAEESHL